MGEIKGFSFYKSYYDCLQDLDKKDQYEMLDAMLDYVFRNKKPKLKGIKKTIWTIIEPNLNTSKNRSNGNSGAPKGNQNACKIRENEEKNETIKKQSKNNQNSINDIKDISLSLSYSLSSSLSYSNSSIINNSILNKLFIEYIKLREDNNYTLSETVIRRLINKLEQANNDEERKEMIEQAILGKWKDFFAIENEKKTKQQRRVF